MSENQIAQGTEHQKKLELLGADRECSACGVHPQWIALESDDSYDVTAVLPFKNADMNMGTVTFAGLRVVTVVCNNCGYIRQHATSILDRTMKDITYYEDQEK